MRVVPEALEELAAALNSAMRTLFSEMHDFGKPELIEKASTEAKATFKKYASALPSARDAYAAALAFVRGHELDDFQYDLLAGALNQKIAERQGKAPIGCDKLPAAFSYYEKEAIAGHLWRLTWFGLLASYFSYDPTAADVDEQRGWLSLRALLSKTWPHIDRANESIAVPDWLSALREHPGLLTETATNEFAVEFLEGNRSPIDALAQCVGIPEGSWFWHALVLSAVRACSESADHVFQAQIPRLLSLIKSRPVFRDEALELILARYHRLPSHPVHNELRDYVVGKDVWRNPKLKAAGIATAWNRVPEAIWRMVLQWVNEGNLRDFFDVLAARNSADEGRLAFWSRYMKQISWTRLIFSSETVSLARSNKEIRALIARESGAYATLTGNKNLDAFIMQIGDYIIVEFSTVGNAAYVYDAATLKFNRYSPSYHGGTEDLRYGFKSGARCRIIHNHGWQSSAAYELSRLGIRPDDDVKQPKAPASTLTQIEARRADNVVTNPSLIQASKSNFPGAFESFFGPLTFAELQHEVGQYPGASIDDRRQATGGRLWVEDPNQDIRLGKQLKSWGFKWANSRSAWYYAE